MKGGVIVSGVLVLDNTLRAIDYISPKRAITLYLLGKAEVVAVYEDMVFHSEHMTIHVPKVISLHVYVPITKKNLSCITKSLLAARDNNTCQYCGKTRDELPENVPMTIDHVKPISHFTGKTKSDRKRKANTWENVALACQPCNTFKDDRTPEEAGMVLLKQPVKPESVIVNLIHRADEAQKEFIVVR